MKPIFERLKYEFDKTLSRGAAGQIGWLAILSIIAIILSSLVVWLFEIPPNTSFGQLLWSNFLRILDTGGIAEVEGSWMLLTILLVLTFFGIFVFSTLIGIINTALQGRIEKLRRGRTKVIENGHTVIFGWTCKTIAIIRELVIANESLSGGCIVVLADIDKVTMEEEIISRAGALKGTRVVCRSGSIADLSAPEIVRLETAKSIIILGKDGPDHDIEVIKSLLSVTKYIAERNVSCNILAEVVDNRNLKVTKTICKDKAEIIAASDMVARIIVQASRQRGLALIYDELLSFRGNEFYFFDQPSLIGKSFKEASDQIGEAIVVGIAHSESSTVKLNPDRNTILTHDDQLIVLAEDEDVISLGLASPTRPMIKEKQARPAATQQKKPEKTLILGWNWRLPEIVRELDIYVASGSILQIYAQLEMPKRMQDEIRQFAKNYNTVEIDIIEKLTRTSLESLDVTSYQEIILLNSVFYENPDDSDAHNLVNLIHLRDIISNSENEPAIVTEISNIQTRDLIDIGSADDFVISDLMVSKVLAQLSENRDLIRVFDILLAPSNVEIILCEVDEYTDASNIAFEDLEMLVEMRGEIALGYYLFDKDGGARSEVVLNPGISKRGVGLKPSDHIAVLRS